MWAQYLAAQRRVTELETARNDLVDRLANVQTHNADLRACIAHLRAEITELRVQGMVEVQAQGATLIVLDPLSQFSSPDMVDPPRRPDGTRAPQPKPWTPPKANGDARRIGG